MSTPRLQTYRTIGPFDADTLPKGLLAEHRLKTGALALLRVIAGEIGFVWDDGERESQVLAAGDTLLGPPRRPHHLALRGDFLIEIEFQRRV